MSVHVLVRGRADESHLFRALVLCLVVVAPLVAKAPLLLGLLDSDPALLFSGVRTSLDAGWFPGLPTIDPNIGFTSHALGHRAALDLFGGSMPWWNPFEGVGAPLVGEMQSAALFPLTWLLLLPDGQLYFHLALQLIAGLGAWLLLRKLGCTSVAAGAGAIAFELNGTFAWLANAAVNPIPFLPWAILGVEIVREAQGRWTRGGAALIATALAASLYAGFPEVAYIDGLLVGAWTLVRGLGQSPPAVWRYFGRALLGALAGIAIAAPVLVPFLDFLPLADLGGHHGPGFATLDIHHGYLLALLAPYAFGGVSQYPWYAPFWGNVGGYAGCVLAALAICGALGREHRPLRILLSVWVAATVAFSYGLPGLHQLSFAVPGLGSMALYRYAPPSWEFSLCVLAALGLTDIARAPRRWTVLAGMGLAFLGLVTAFLVARGEGIYLGAWVGRASVVLGALLLIGGEAIAWFVKSFAWRSVALAVLLVAEAGVCFLPTAVAWPAGGVIETAGIGYLRANLGLQRFVTLRPIQPNYGSYFGLASINHNDIPVPKAWSSYVARRLDREAPGVLFTGATVADDIARDPDAFRKVGVRYVLAPTGGLDTEPFKPLLAGVGPPPDGHLVEVFRDPAMQIFELSRPAPYFQAPGCALRPASREKVEATCAAPSALTRLELHMPGWTARVNGEPSAIRTTQEIFQQTALPAGRSVISFRFEPPFIAFAYAAFVAGWLALLAEALWRRRRTATPR